MLKIEVLKLFFYLISLDSIHSPILACAVPSAGLEAVAGHLGVRGYFPPYPVSAIVEVS